MPEKSNGKFLRCLLVFFSLFIAKHGPDMLLNQLESVQAGLLEQFLTHVWAPKLALVVTDATDKKICQVSVRTAKKKKARTHRASCAARTKHKAHIQKQVGSGGVEEVGGCRAHVRHAARLGTAH